MRTPASVLGARGLIQRRDLVFTGQGNPRAALDKGDLRITDILAHHPVESHRQLPGRGHLRPALRAVCASTNRMRCVDDRVGDVALIEDRI